MTVSERPGPRQNRVLPSGEIMAVPQRGSWLGNRGILHDGADEAARIVRLHRGPLWIICALEHKGWQLPQWQPHHFTVLFFHDEAVALAAGHRPCALCRRPAYNAFRAAWVAANGLVDGRPPRAFEMDRRLHAERLVRRTRVKRVHPMPWTSLPDGVFVSLASGPALVCGDEVRPWSPEGYAEPDPRPRAGSVDVLTPPSTVGAIRAGYRPHVAAATATPVAASMTATAVLAASTNPVRSRSAGEAG